MKSFWNGFGDRLQLEMLEWSEMVGKPQKVQVKILSFLKKVLGISRIIRRSNIKIIAAN